MEKQKEIKKENKAIISMIIFVTLIILAISGITYAFYTSSVRKNNLSALANCYTVNYTKGQDITGELTMGSDYTNGHSTDIIMYSNPDCDNVVGTIYITTNEESTMDLTDKALKYTVVSNEIVLATGSVDGTVNQPIYTDFVLNDTPTTYQIYLWLDETLEDNSTLESESYSGFIHADVRLSSKLDKFYIGTDTSGANHPELTDGLIPVMYDESRSTWVKADTTSSTSEYGWYDYDNKKWANAVLVADEYYKVNLNESNKSVNITNEQVTSYNVGNYGFISLEFTTGATGGDFSFDYEASFTVDMSQSSLDFNDSTIFWAYNGTVPNSCTLIYYGLTYCYETFSKTLEPNTSYSIDADSWDGWDSDIYSISENITILNIKLPEGSSELTVTDHNNTNFTINDTNSLKTYSRYSINEEGKFILDNYADSDRVAGNDLINRYICSDLKSIECDEIYEIKTVNGNTITSVDSYVINLEGNGQNRNLLKEADPGTEIPEEAILAYYVWIPRFKYKVWNKDKVIGVDAYNAQNTGIDIIFESSDFTTGDVRCTYDFNKTATDTVRNEECSGTNGESYYTHPAFLFGDKKTTGFWIGKFELSSTEQRPFINGGGNSTTLTPRILPNKINWTDNYLTNFYLVIKNMQSTNNIYGLSTDTNTADSHMITNMEWGAVAYLTNSKYGRCTGGENSTCTKLAPNNSGFYYSDDFEEYGYSYTGRSSGTPESSDYTDEGTYTYDEINGQLSSTTGNIYGVYDMSGGAIELVMGNMSEEEGIYTYYQSSAGKNYTYGESTAKYLNTYATGANSKTNQTDYNKTRLGDATGEVIQSGGNYSWYNGTQKYPYGRYSWFMRGNDYSSDGSIFSFNINHGYTYDYSSSTRATLIVY